MDVLDNPFVRLEFMIRVPEALEQFAAHGFRLWSSWPRYGDGLDVHRPREERNLAEQVRQPQSNYARNCLGYAIGRKAYVVDDERNVAHIAGKVFKTVQAVDAAIDDPTPSGVRRAMHALALLETAASQTSVLTDAVKHMQHPPKELSALRSLLELLEGDDFDAIWRFCNHDVAFIGAWGSPNHLAVLERTAG